MRRPAAFALAALLWAMAGAASAEPIFLSRQYARCTACHFSPTGGGMLTPYGRSLSREELSTWGSSGGTSSSREEEFLFGALGDTLRGVSVGATLRPAHLDIEVEDLFEETRDFLMNANVTAAYRHKKWTVYGELGRQPRDEDVRVTSFEHWVSYQSGRLGARAGRFLPAYGVRFADHTTFNRSTVGLDNDEQVYALELNHTTARHLLQVSAGAHADSPRVFTAAGRWQVDLSPRTVLVASGLFRDASEEDPQNAAAGLAFGISPHSRVTLWTQADLRFRDGTDKTENAYTLVGDAAVEAYRGVWVRLSAQLLTEFEDDSAGTFRLAAGFNLLPRTHWNVILNWYRDHDRASGLNAHILMAQLHLYL